MKFLLPRLDTPIGHVEANASRIVEIAGEAADILFHMQVALAHHGVSWRRVQEVLAKRRGAPRRE